MREDIIIFLLGTLGLASLLGDPFVFKLLYLFAGAYALGGLWSAYSLRSLTFRRTFVDRAFSGDNIPVTVELENTGWLPMPWLRVQDSVSVDLRPGGTFQQVLSLGWRTRTVCQYELLARKRGRYPIGPLLFSAGDVFGLSGDQTRQGETAYLTVYPRIVPLAFVGLPSRSPFGALPHSQPIYEDPSRVRGKRDYAAGDSLRRVDWKSSAAVGRLQVKLFEPSIALETAIFLNLNEDEYDTRSKIDATDLAIIIAASLANWIVSKKQSVGLYTNGLDPLAENEPFHPTPPRKGQAHMMRVLDVLARVQSTNKHPYLPMLRRAASGLSWGTTVVLITGQANEAVFDEIFALRRAGHSPMLVLSGAVYAPQAARQKAEQFKVPFFNFRNEFDMDVWRQAGHG